VNSLGHRFEVGIDMGASKQWSWFGCSSSSLPSSGYTAVLVFGNQIFGLLLGPLQVFRERWQVDYNSTQRAHQ
jgi:hypothetical protein